MRRLLTFTLAVAAAATAWAANMTGWTDLTGGFHEFDAKHYGLHLTDEKGYGESYYLAAWSAEGDGLVAMLSVTNYHPFKNHLQSVDLNWIDRSGTPILTHAEYEAKDLQPDTGDGTIGMGPNRVRFERSGGQMRFDTGDLKAEVRYRNVVPPAISGDGSLKFDGGKTHWTYLVQAPCAVVEARVRTKDGQERVFNGMGYVDHGWATEKVPDFSTEWHRIQMCDSASGVGLSIFQIVPEKKYGHGPLHQIHVMDGDTLVAINASGTLTPENRQKNKKSGYMVPQSYTFVAAGEGYDLKGRIDNLSPKADVDVLGALSWLTRSVVKTFYAKPWQHWASGTMTVEGTLRGRPVKVSAPTLVSAQYYD